MGIMCGRTWPNVWAGAVGCAGKKYWAISDTAIIPIFHTFVLNSFCNHQSNKFINKFFVYFVPVHGSNFSISKSDMVS